ncbi:MAG: S-layer homology domain-containing protein [Elainellaceae cyanobacterium]
MRFYTAAIYTLAAFTVRDFTQQAIASPPPEPLPDVPENNDAVDVADVPGAIDPVIPPETLSTSDFSSPASLIAPSADENLVAEGSIDASQLDLSQPDPSQPGHLVSASSERIVFDRVIIQDEFQMATSAAYRAHATRSSATKNEAAEPVRDADTNSASTISTASASRSSATELPSVAATNPRLDIAEPERMGDRIYTAPESDIARQVAAIEADIMEHLAARRQTQQLSQATSFSGLADVEGTWAESSIRALVAEGIIQGFDDGTFRPNAPVTRAQYATMIQTAFPTVESLRPSFAFVDVPVNHWAATAIQSAYQNGFLNGTSAQQFAPDQTISRAEAIASLVRGLRLTATNESAASLPDFFDDAEQISADSRGAIAAAIDHDIIVNYPDVTRLNPNQSATRADTAAFLYQALSTIGQVPDLPATANVSRYVVTSGSPQTIPRSSSASLPSPSESSSPRSTSSAAAILTAADCLEPPNPDIFERTLLELDDLEQLTSSIRPFDRSAPALTIANPAGFGVDGGTVFISGTFQEDTRYSEEADGAVGIGIGLGDARRAVGVELSYTIASFGSNRNFGTGGFNARIHRRFSDSLSASVGWNGFLITGEEDGDFEDSIYGSMTKIFRLRDSLSQPFSRLAVTGGAGTGQFRHERDIAEDNSTVSPFGSIALRIAEPVSFITEWTGQDLAMGLSIAPFRNANIVITPAVRDIAGAGDGARFVLGFGASF